MKSGFASIGLVFLALSITSASHGRDFPVLKGPYMGQTPPGMTAEVFAPDIVSTDAWELEGVFAPGMREFYFTEKGGENNRPTVVGFRQERQYLEKIYRVLAERGSDIFA